MKKWWQIEDRDEEDTKGTGIGRSIKEDNNYPVQCSWLKQHRQL